jgi:PAS domain S-box-containing protein
MNKTLRVLLVEDSEDDALLLLRELRMAGYDPVSARVDTAPDLDAALDSHPWDAIISDYRMPQFSGLAALKLIHGRGLDLPFILVSGAIGEDIAVDAMRAGAHDYLVKGSLARLAPAIERELRDAEARHKRKAAEASLRESEERFRLLVDATPDYAIFMLDPAGRISSWNTGARRIKGYESDDILGRHFSCFFPDDVARSGWPGRELEIASSEGRFENEGWQVRKDGSRFWANTVLAPLRDDAANLIGFSRIARDLTLQKSIEDEIRTLNHELESRVIERTAALLAAVDSLEAEIVERRRLEREILEIGEREKGRVGQDLHDGLCQTLTGISLIAKVLQRNLEEDKLLPGAASEDTKMIVSLVKEAINEARSLAMEMYPVNIEEYGLAAALEKLALNMSNRFRITCRFKCSQPVTLADKQVATHVYRITQEAVSNAFKHGRANLVLIVLSHSGDQVSLTVEDNGNGLLQNVKPTGMGLKTMHYRARAIGGSLEIRQRSRHGLAVVCSFPNQQKLEV